MDNSEGQTYSAPNEYYNAKIPSEKEIKHIDENVEINNESEQDPPNGEANFIGTQGKSPSEGRTHGAPNKNHNDSDMLADTEISPEKDDATPTNEGQTYSAANKNDYKSPKTEIPSEREIEQHNTQNIVNNQSEENSRNGEAIFSEKQEESPSESSSEHIEDDETPTNAVLFQSFCKGRLDDSQVKEHIELAELRRYPDGEASESDVPEQSSKRRVEQAMEYLKLVETFQNNGQYDEALYYCTTALNLLEFPQDINLRMKFYSNIMQLYFLQGNIDAVFNTYYEHCERVLELVTDPKVIQTIMDMHTLCVKKWMKEDKI